MLRRRLVVIIFYAGGRCRCSRCRHRLLRKSFISGLVDMSALAPVHFKAINKRQEAAMIIFSTICMPLPYIPYIYIYVKIAKNMLNLVCMCVHSVSHTITALK